MKNDGNLIYLSHLIANDAFLYLFVLLEMQILPHMLFGYLLFASSHFLFGGMGKVASPGDFRGLSPTAGVGL